MPAITVELPAFLSALFPYDPVRLGPLVLQRRNVADQMVEDARLIAVLDEKLRALIEEEEQLRDAAEHTLQSSTDLAGRP